MSIAYTRENSQPIDARKGGGGFIVASDIVTEINREHELFQSSMKSALEHAIRCGQLLIEQKSQLEHGEWLPWVMMNCNFSERHARRYMQLAEEYVSPNRTRVSDLDEPKSIREALSLLTEPKPVREVQEPPVWEDTTDYDYEPRPRVMVSTSLPQGLSEPEREIAFSWAKHPLVIAGQSGLDALQAMVATLLRANRDVSVAAYYLDMARKAMKKMIADIDNVLGDEDDVSN